MVASDTYNYDNCVMREFFIEEHNEKTLPGKWQFHVHHFLNFFICTCCCSGEKNEFLAHFYIALSDKNLTVKLEEKILPHDDNRQECTEGTKKG